ncbi:universal stress protein [Xylanimonas protaetiae]|uniref:Universal stress protein n=1 Tax=Xylanimonas protaetiae TaxID=2509457 RepID=A0A4P6F7B4_9MICO|nr:universal stress protein [Xylanimonas protaetiae]QAY69127.1 universal stress protein [Xylanimonas protaetiae]
MTRPEIVLVGVDGSAPSLHALDWAAAYAKRVGWALHMVCSYSLPSFTAASLDGGYAALDDTAIQEGAKAVLVEAQERVAGHGLPVTASVATGDAAGVLVEMSKDYGLAVVGTRGRGGFTERLLGTVSSALPAHAKCPVVVVPLRTPKSNGAPEADRRDGDVVHEVRRIIVGVDGSPSAEAALKVAITQAKVWDAELVAVAGVPVGSGAGVLAWLPAQIDHEQVLADIKAGLDVIVDRYEAANDGLKIKRIVLDGTGAELLTEFSTAADLLVVGSRGRGGFRGLLLGSTSQAVLHHAACPVLVVNRKSDPDE